MNAYRILVGKPFGKCSLVRLRKTEMKVTKTSCGDKRCKELVRGYV